MRLAAAFFLVAAMGATAGTTAVTLQPSSMSFKQASASCAGALGSITFTLGHTRVAAAAGVDTDSDSSAGNSESITFTDSKSARSAVVTVNAQKHSVAARNVQAKAHDSVACILPD